MASSKTARRIRRNHARYRGRHGLTVIPMIDMMVILVIFLIFSAVFSKTNILELSLPTADTVIPDLPEGFQLEVVMHLDRIDVADRVTGLLKSLPNTNQGYDFSNLAAYLYLVKVKYPQKRDATVLLEPTIPYNDLVQVMDAMRVYNAPDTAVTPASIELFPDISIGDAPI